MNCDEAKLLIAAQHDGELDASSAARFAAHLATCDACRSELQELAQLRSDLQQQGTQYKAPAYLKTRISNALAAQAQPKPVAAKKNAFKFSWAWLNAGFAGGGALAFTFMLSLYLSRPSDLDLLEQDIVATHARSMMVNHLSDVASTDQHTVKPWFADKLDFAPNVADFSAQGYPLVGGRLDYLDTRNVAAIVYRHRLHTINLIEWPERGHAPAPALSVTREGYQLQHWNQNGMNYWLISDMNARELNDFKNLLVEQVEKSEQR